MGFKLFCAFLFVPLFITAQEPTSNYVKENYLKIDTVIAMRDGAKLYTIIYTPKDNSKAYPILMERTPYSSGPYGDENYKRRIGPNEALMHGKYIFVYQDVRGRYMSEGHNKEVTPYIPNKQTNKDVDESSDTYDTIEWLLKFLKNDNGKVGLYGISYPGFYATASLPGAHSAIKAVSPQAPVTDEFIGDDANHNGAFFLMDNFFFMNYYGKERNGPTEDYGSSIFNIQTNDTYDFFMKLGPVKNSQNIEYFDNRSYIWNEYLEHDTYDDYWQRRNIRQHLKNVSIPTLVVGGWFDAEDLFGALHTYQAIAKQGGKNNFLVMGPWTHGAWARAGWSKFGSYDFGSNTSGYFQDSLQTKFFDYYLKGIGDFDVSKATVFETGSNQWKHFAVWPPQNVEKKIFYFSAEKSLSENKNGNERASDTYISDPQNPVPYTGKIMGRRNNEYMVEDQSFASERNDVLTYTTRPLEKDLTVAGPVGADLYVSMDATDADFIVKLIEVIPLPSDDVQLKAGAKTTGNFQRLVRAEVMRGKFRDSYEKPQPFISGKPTLVHINLNDIMHTFKKGHQIMVQVQSSWFPLVDRNPQIFMRIPDAKEKDFQRATIRIYRDAAHPSSIVLPILH